MICGDDAEVLVDCSGEVQWNVTHGPGETVVSLHGELDMAGTPALGPALAAIVGRGPGRVVIDLEQLSFLDSSGMSCLIAAARQADAAGCELVVRNPSGIVARVLQISGVDDLLLDSGSDGEPATRRRQA